MSVLIKGMTLPFSCWECECHSVAKGTRYCNFVYGSWYRECVDMYVNERHPNCPLIEVPTPHGDLIDKTVLLQDLFDVDVEMSRDGYRPTISDAFDEVGLAIAIVRAEV